jgi:hypothetical protein
MPLYHPFIKYVLLIFYKLVLNFYKKKLYQLLIGILFVLYTKTILVYQILDTRPNAHKTLLKIFEATKAR